MQLNKKLNKKNGGNVINASVDLIKSMTELGSSIFIELKSITNIHHDLNNGAASSSGIPNNIEGPPKFKPPY